MLDYTVYYKQGWVTTQYILRQDVQDLSISVAGLDLSQKYTFAVVARNQIGSSEQSPEYEIDLSTFGERQQQCEQAQNMGFDIFYIISEDETVELIDACMGFYGYNFIDPDAKGSDGESILAVCA